MNTLRASLLLARREFLSAFDAPVGYLILAFLPAVSAVMLFVLGPFFALDTADENIQDLLKSIIDLRQPS